LSADRTSADHRRLARRALTLLVALAVPIAAVAGAVAGTPGVVGALIGVGFVALLFGAASTSLAWAVDNAPNLAVVVLGVGTFVRLAIYAAVLVVLADVAWVHPPSLAIATGVATACTLAAELVWLARTPQLFHVDAGPSPSATEPVGPNLPCSEHVTTGSRSL
jgi:hypothetical protein